MWFTLLFSALAADPCLDRECLFCLIGEPVTSAAVQPAVSRYELTEYSDELFGGRGVALGFGSDRRVSAVIHVPQTCGANCHGGVPFGLSATADKAAIEAALPGGAWATKRGSTFWSATRGPLGVTVHVDSAGRAQRIEVRATGGLDAVRTEWCRDGAWPGVRRVDGTAGEGEALPGDGVPRADVMVTVSETWWKRFREAPDGSAQRAHAMAVAEAADALASASKSLHRSADSLVEAGQASSNTAARAPYLNGHVDLSQAAYNLDTAAGRLRTAVAEAQKGGLTDEASRATARLADVEELRAQVSQAYDDLPRADEVVAASMQVAPLMGTLVIGVLRFDARVAEIVLAL